MASLVEADDAAFAEYCGLLSIFEYTNQDGTLTTWNCGQAAMATLLTHHGLLEADPGRAEAQMRQIEDDYPPNVLGGWFGTSRGRVEKALRNHGLPVAEVRGEDALRAALEQRNPVAVMLGVPGPRWCGVQLPGGHWMIAYGFDERRVYLTNWGSMSWDEFRRGWGSLVSRLIRMNGRGLTVQPGVTLV